MKQVKSYARLMKRNNMKRLWDLIIAAHIINVRSGDSNQLHVPAAYRLSWDFSLPVL
jgi:hypothetical protein